ncbi:MAG: O-antigen ligase family protein [Chloroflexi bacterium]|nr:O-antigen ligase family protein [Chloroflexota bacterium]
MRETYPTHPGGPTTALIVMATTVAATFTMLFAGGSGSLENGLFRILYDLGAASALIIWLVMGAWRPGWLPSSSLLAAISAALAVFTVASVTSRVPRLSLEMLGYAVLLAGLYLLLVTLMRRARIRKHFQALALVLCVLVCGLYLLQVFEAWQAWWLVVGHLAIPPLRPGYLGLSLGSPNPIATLVLLLGAFGLATAPLARTRGRILAAMLVAVVAIVTVITGSRGAWLGGGVALVVCAGAALVFWPGTQAAAIAFVRSRRGAVVATVALACVVVAGILAERSGRLTLGDEGYREAFAAASLRMLQSSPLVGIGPGVWQILRAANETATQPDLYIPHAHNIYLQTLAEFGLLGVVAGVVLAASLGSLIIGGLHSGDAPRRRVALAALFGIVLLATQQLVDMLMNVPALLLAIALPLAWLDATAEMPPATRPVASTGVDPAPTVGAGVGARGMPRLHSWRIATGGPLAARRALALGAAAVVLVILAGLLRVEAVAGRMQPAIAASDAGRWADAVAPAREAATADPAVSAYWFTLGVAAANAGDLALAASALQTSASADDYTYAWLDLAAVRWRGGDLAVAREALDRAERLGWQRAPLAIAAGWLREQLGDRTAAVADDAAAIIAAPTLAGDPYWRSTATLRGMWPAILAAVHAQVARSPGTAADHAGALFAVDLIAGSTGDVSRDLGALDSPGRALAEVVVPAWQGVPGAEARLQALAEAHPLEPRPVTWCQLVAARNGETTLVQRYGTWIAQGLSGGAPVARITFGRPQPYANGVLDRYGSLYRRPVPADQVIGILPQLSFQDHF